MDGYVHAAGPEDRQQVENPDTCGTVVPTGIFLSPGTHF